jgi:chromate reductase
MDIIIYDGLAGIPPYNEDVEKLRVPDIVAALKQAIADADALLFATPEYNYGIPGVLKNAFDWASRPPAETPLRNKAASIIGATPGRGGTIRAQMQLRQAFVFTQTYALLQPEVLVTAARERFDSDGTLTDEPTREVLGKHLAALLGWTRKIAGSGTQSGR